MPNHSCCRARQLKLSLLMAFFAASLLVSSAAPLWSQSFDDIERRAAEARQARQPDEAVALYREGLKLKPDWNEGRWYLGTTLFGLKQYDAARDAFLQLAAAQPGNGQAWALAGMCEFELNDRSHALQHLSQSESVGLNDNSELAALVEFRIALLLNRSGQSQQATDRLIPIALAGSYPQVIEALGLCLLRAPLLPSEIPQPDHDFYTRAGKAMYAYIRHDTPEAARLFEQLVSSYPDRPGVHYARGGFLVETDPEKALEEFLRELEINPSDINALSQAAKLYLKQGAAARALPYARRAVELDPDNAAARRVLGESLLASGDPAGSIQQLRKAAQLAPDFPQTHFLLANAYRRAGNAVLASTEMAEFQRLDTARNNASTSPAPPK